MLRLRMMNYQIRYISKLFCLLISCCALTTLAQKPTLVVQSGHTAPITDMVFSHDGRFLLSGSFDRSLKLWNPVSGKELITYPEYSKFTTAASITFSPDDQYIVSGANDGSLKLWSTIMGRIVHEIPKYAEGITSVAFHPKENIFASGASDGTIRFWSSDTGDSLGIFAGHKGDVNSIAFSPNGKYLVSGDTEGVVKLWGTDKTTPLHTFWGKEKINSVAFSPNGRYILAASADGRIRIWKKLSRKLWNEFKSEEDKAIVRASFSPNGEQVLAGTVTGLIYLWDLKSGKLLHKSTKDHGLLSSPIFFPNGKSLMVAHNRLGIRQIDIETGKTTNTFKRHGGNVFSSYVVIVEFSPDGKNILSAGGDNQIRFWGENTGKGIPLPFRAIKAKFSPDGRKVAGGGAGAIIFIWNRITGEILHELKGHTNAVFAIAFSPDGRYLASGSKDRSIRLWDVETGQFIRQLDSLDNATYSLHFSKDGQYILAGDGGGGVRLWDAVTGKLIRNFANKDGAAFAVDISPDGKYVVAGKDDKLYLWRVKDGKWVYRQTAHDEFISSTSFSPDGQYIISTSGDKTIKLWESETGNLVQTFIGHKEGVIGTDFSPNGKFIVSGSNDNTIKLWEINSGKNIATIYPLGYSEWAIVTPEGLFDASSGGMEFMHYMTDMEAIELQQLKERYYEPQLLQKLLGFHVEPIRDVTAFQDIELFPKMTLEIKAKKQAILDISLKERSGGIGKVSFFINNKEVIEDVNIERKKNIKINLDDFEKFYYFDKENTLQVQAYNEKGWMMGQRENLLYKPSKKRKRIFKKEQNNPFKLSTKGGGDKPKITINLSNKHQPNFYSVIIGTADYRGEQLDLIYSDKDARDIAKAMEDTAIQLFGEDNTHVRLLTTDAQQAEQLSSKANIEATFKEFAEDANPDDILLVYLSGHGVTYGGQNASFYYLTKDVESGDISDPSIRQNYAISTEEFTNWITTVPANKQIMILDACSSGRAVENILSQTRNVSSSQRRALDRMKDRTGMFVLSGSTADKVSYEASQFGQGLLTYTVLLGMSGTALRENEFIDVMTLFQFAADKVPEFAEYIGGIQRPMIAAPNGGNSFDIGKINENVVIPLAEVKPLFIRSNFQEETQYEDQLDLSEIVDYKLLDISARGKSASIIYVDIKKYPQAYSIKGRYTIEDNKVHVKGKLFKGKRFIGEFTVDGFTQNTAQIGAAILEEVQKLTK